MSTYKIDQKSLKLLGSDNWLSVVSFFDLSGSEELQFMSDYSISLPQGRLSRYISYIHKKYINTYAKFFEGDVKKIPLRYIFQGEDCPRNFESVSWQSQIGWGNICLVPDLYYFLERGYENFLPENIMLPAWSSRHATVMWRGSTTGVIDGADCYTVGFGLDTLPQLPRYRLCRTLKQLGSGADVGIVAVVQCADHQRTEILARLASEGLLAPYVSLTDMAHYKYIVDIDGNTNSWNFVQRLRLGCCILKVESPWIQWLSHRVLPWVHYVPVKADLSDLLEKIEWCRTHDREAQEIANNGRRFGLDIKFETEMRQAALDILQVATPLSGALDDKAALQTVCKSAESLQSSWQAAINAWSSFAGPLWLRTAHGTVLGSGIDGSLVQLPLDGDLTRAIIVSDANDQWINQLQQFHVDRTGNTLSLEKSGMFLSAQGDGVTMTCDRLEKCDWETFTLIPARLHNQPC